ncbi:hypothetical protein [Anaerocellum danielii]|uniref:DnaD domain-containing protein n=1 Tax=Anaerocellum danielii TaxID=1387557 RepID=A0ABZ0TXL3_9FIRM|nr:hypothetical protein [Caldicellulosiruptor danielii]WPX08186.1 hypothetical protein SOJ16_002052 [Caldicellulosiruptor danielii]
MDIHSEIEAFENWLETNYLPITSQFLWYKLLSLFAKAGYPEWLTISNQVLMAKTGINSKHTLIEARNKLLKAGFIEIRTGKKGEPTSYRLISNQERVQKKNQIMHSKSFGAEKGAKNEPNIVPYLENGTEYGANFEPNIAPKEKKGAEYGAKNAPNPAPEEQQNPVDSCSQTTSQNQNLQNDKDINIFVSNNNNNLNKNQDNLEVLKDIKLTNVNTEVDLRAQKTTGEDVSESLPEVNNRKLIADLVKRFEEITGKHDNKLYPLLGQLYNQYGYAEVLWALDRLEWGLRNKKIEKPEGYLINVLKNGNERKKESEADGKHKKDSRKYGELPPDDPYSIIKPIRLGKQPDSDFDPYSLIQPIRLGGSSSS